jgi:penicillin amidase
MGGRLTARDGGLSMRANASASRHLGRRSGVAMTALRLLVQARPALRPRPVTTQERLAVFPTAGLPLDQPVVLRWNDYAVPWIEAETDHDLALTLGLVHAHLRLGQLAVAKRIVQGRLSEMAGRFTRQIDRLLRTIDFGYAAPAIEAAMPPITRAWMQAFVDGLNWYQDHAAAKPPEYGLLGIENEPWSIQDLLAIGRLAGTDINWLTAATLLRARLQPDWPKTWRRVLEAGTGGTMSFKPTDREVVLSTLLAGFSRSGSNALAVAPAHSASGGALIASDPHLGIFLPNFWILLGLKSPSFHAVGLMPPGLPVLGLGRNDDIAWSGTNMHAAASDLYDISGEPPDSIRSRRQRIKTRLWLDRDVTIRRSTQGPIVSDTPFFPGRPGEVIALRWKGHEGSDEISAFLKVMQARGAQEFRKALESYGVAGQNMLCATRTGDICQVMAVHLPIRAVPSDDLVRNPHDPAAVWHGEANAMTLPWALNPPEGLLASANNRPTETPIPVAYFFPLSERVERIYALLRTKQRLSLGDLAELQLDTFSAAALELKDNLVDVIKAIGADRGQPAFIGRLETWDGGYEADSPGPVAFETLLYELAQRLYARGSGTAIEAIKAEWSYLTRYLVSDLQSLPQGGRAALLIRALKAAAADSRRYMTWGDMHRMRVGYILANTPFFRRFFSLDNYAVGGSRNTVMKTAHGLVKQRHNISYGSQARQLCDMSDPDANRFVLFGGQDGWLGSANFADQVALWRAARSIRMPLRAETVAAEFPTAMRLMPAR